MINHLLSLNWYFSYFSLFLLSNGSRGPRSLLKASVSREATTTSVLALIVACLLFSPSRASSPK